MKFQSKCLRYSKFHFIF